MMLTLITQVRECVQDFTTVKLLCFSLFLVYFLEANYQGQTTLKRLGVKLHLFEGGVPA